MKKLSAAARKWLDEQARADDDAAEQRGECLVFARATEAGDELFIYGDIGAGWWDDDNVTARQVNEQLSGLTGKQLTVRVNSYGGRVDDGLAIHNSLLLHKQRTGATITVRVDAIAASIASLIVQAGDQRVMPENATMMVHAPWTGFCVAGNATELEAVVAEVVEWLRHIEETTALTYASRMGVKAAEFRASYYDGKDHSLTATAALEAGLIDEVEALRTTEEEDAEALAGAVRQAMAAAFARGLQRYSPEPAAMAAATRAFAHLPAAQAAIPDSSAAAGTLPPAASGTKANEAHAMDKTPEQLAAEQRAAVDKARTDAIAAMKARNAEIKALAEPHLANAEVRAYCDKVVAEADPDVSAADVGKELLKILAKGRESLGGDIHVPAGGTEVEKFRQAGVNAILAKAGVLKGEKAEAALGGNPLAHATMLGIAEQCLMRAGVRTRDFNRGELARHALQAQTTSDFPNLLANALHKVVIAGYAASRVVWPRFCRVGMLTDYRPHPRYVLSSFSDLKETTEKGEYDNGTLADAQVESIQGKRKGRILELSPEVLVNDDLGFLVGLAQHLGGVAGRTIDKDVIALLALNAGLGPTMSDQKTLFHADHKNIDSTTAAPTVASMDAGAQLMAAQTDPSGLDILDLTPAVWLGPRSKAGAARVVVGSEYDPDANNKLQRANIAKDLVQDVVGTARLTGTRWYLFADPAVQAVIEVAFLHGIREPQLTQDTNFRTDGLAWKVTHNYAVGAVDFRGATTNGGA